MGELRYKLPEEFRSLGRKKQDMLFRITVEERKDAALNGVVIGLKALNHVHGVGLERLAKLSNVWGNDIVRWYTDSSEDHYMGWSDSVESAGAPQTNVDEVFFDLSDSMRRKISRFLEMERKDAQWNACMVGEASIRRFLHFGDKRIEQLTDQWGYDIRDFYQDREINEPRLKEWIEDIGFIFEDGKLQCYMTKDGQRHVRKRTYEKYMEEDDNGILEVQGDG